MTFTARQAVELFHLFFLRALAAKGEDKSLFVVKGGCNLRFYFGSIRYSEDMDLDVAPTVLEGTLENKVDRLLASPAVLSPLRAKGIDVVETSKPKQTGTTQRWKAGLRIAELGDVRTKIEFSRRDALEGTAFEAVEREILRPYALPTFLATHYTTPRAIAQKVSALANRREPQARDIFDLNHLLARTDAAGVTSGMAPEVLGKATENAMSIGFDDYTSQVVAFLDPEQAETFASRDSWNAMQDEVVAELQRRR